MKQDREKMSALELANAAYGGRGLNSIPEIMDKLTAEEAQGGRINETLDLVSDIILYPDNRMQSADVSAIFKSLKPFANEPALQEKALYNLRDAATPELKKEISKTLFERYYAQHNALGILTDICSRVQNYGDTILQGVIKEEEKENHHPYAGAGFDTVARKMSEDVASYGPEVVRNNRSGSGYSVEAHSTKQAYIDAFVKKTDELLVSTRTGVHRYHSSPEMSEGNKAAIFEMIKPYYGESKAIAFQLWGLEGSHGERKEEIAKMQTDAFLRNGFSQGMIIEAMERITDEGQQTALVNGAFEKLPKEAALYEKHQAEKAAQKAAKEEKPAKISLLDRVKAKLGVKPPEKEPKPLPDKDDYVVAFLEKLESRLRYAKQNKNLSDGAQQAVITNIDELQRQGNSKIYGASKKVLGVLGANKVYVGKKKAEIKARLPQYTQDKLEFLEKNPTATTTSGVAYADQQATQIIRNKKMRDKLAGK